MILDWIFYRRLESINLKMLSVLICPNCCGDLELKILKQKDDAILEGSLICHKCNKIYPIEHQVINFLPDQNKIF